MPPRQGAVAPARRRSLRRRAGLGNKVVHTSRQMLNEIGREPTPEELAEKLGMPLEKVRKVLKIAKEPRKRESSATYSELSIGSLGPRFRGDERGEKAFQPDRNISSMA